MKKRNLLLIFTMVTVSSLCLLTSCMQGGGSESSPQTPSYSSDGSLQEEQSPRQEHRASPYNENEDMPIPRHHQRRMLPPPDEEMGELPPPMPEYRNENNEISDDSDNTCNDGSCDSESGSHTHHHRHRHHKKTNE